MKSYMPENVINGTYGEVWIDGEYMAEALGLEAKITLEKTEVHQVGRLSKRYKVTGVDCKGTVKLNKVSSYFIKKLSDSLKSGKLVPVTIISKLADPNAIGAERIELIGCTFDELALVNWEVKKLGEESIPFTFTDWNLLDVI